MVRLFIYLADVNAINDMIILYIDRCYCQVADVWATFWQLLLPYVCELCVIIHILVVVIANLWEMMLFLTILMFNIWQMLLSEWYKLWQMLYHLDQ